MRKSKFNLSNDKLFTCDLGELIPAGITEVLPGDQIQHHLNAVLRTQPLLSPVMHELDVRIHHFFVPMRLIWSEWENFITGGPLGTSLPVYPTFQQPAGGAAIGSLSDYLGIPTTVANLVHSALPLRAYGLIWNEFFRDQDLDTALVVSTASGVDATTNALLQTCSWEKDYFTSARPTEQKGPTVTVPLGTTAPLQLNPLAGALAAGKVRVSSTGALLTVAGALANDAAGSIETGGGTDLTYDPNGTLVANLAAASGVSVSVLRQSLAAQKLMERRLRKGSRYEDMLRDYGVRNLDARLDKPEYLGGGHETIQFSEVLQTAADGANPVGTLRGHGIAAMRSNAYRRTIPEHGYIMTLFSVRPKTVYFQGLDRHWNRRVKEDFFQPEFQHIGQQVVKNKELYAAHLTPEGTFGFQDRYDEYRTGINTLAGEFRSSVLNFWHLAREFSSSPALNATFVKCVPSERVFPVPANDVLLVMGRHKMMARRVVTPVGTSFIS
jgi:hypothetical protein